LQHTLHPPKQQNTQAGIPLRYLYPPKQQNTQAGIPLRYLSFVDDHLQFMQKLEFGVKLLVKNGHCKSWKKI
jgi:hypothetical protein